jgi:L-ribulose-5-phosphate 3-epimerase
MGGSSAVLRTIHPAMTPIPVGEPISRRSFLGGAAAVAAAALLPAKRVWAAGPDASAAPAGPAAGPRHRIAVCDWMILKRQKLGAFKLAREIGADGVEVDMGGLGDRPTFDSKLGDPAVRQQFLEEAWRLNLEICSLAMSGFYAQSFAERPGVDRMVQDCLDTMRAMQVRTAFLPLGVRGDLVKRPELRPAVIARLQAAGAQAARAGVVIGIETALDAAGERRLLDDIGSPAVRSYFNFANAVQAGRNLCAELRTLGRDRICQIHCTGQDGLWLQDDPKIDLRKVRETLDGMGWSGWLVIERSRSAKDPKNVKWNFGANAAYLKKVFQEGP